MKFGYQTSRHNEKGTLLMGKAEIIKFYIKEYIARIYTKGIADIILKNPDGKIDEKEFPHISTYLNFIKIIENSESTAVVYKFLLKKSDTTEQIKAKVAFLLEESNQSNVTSLLSFFFTPISMSDAVDKILRDFRKNLKLPNDKSYIKNLEFFEDKNKAFLLFIVFLNSSNETNSL
jgi:hypothetical protein